MVELTFMLLVGPYVNNTRFNPVFRRENNDTAIDLYSASAYAVDAAAALSCTVLGLLNDETSATSAANWTTQVLRRLQASQWQCEGMDELAKGQDIHALLLASANTTNEMNETSRKGSPYAGFLDIKQWDWFGKGAFFTSDIQLERGVRQGVAMTISNPQACDANGTLHSEGSSTCLHLYRCESCKGAV